MKDFAPVKLVKSILFDWRYFTYLAIALIVCDSIATFTLMQNVPFKKASWTILNRHAKSFLEGERDYGVLRNVTKKEGDLPAVGPAGYIYLSAAIHLLTNGGTNTILAQYVWGVLYIVTLIIVFALMKHSKVTPPWAAIVLCCSRQIHSLYVLQSSSDSWSMLFIYCALLLLIYDQWLFATVSYCVAVSLNMDVLGFLPGFFCLYIQRFGFTKAIRTLIVGVISQILIAYPFLAANPLEYIAGVINIPQEVREVASLSWRFFIPSFVVVSPYGVLLFFVRLFVLLYIVSNRWWPRVQPVTIQFGFGKPLPAADIVMEMFTSNYIRIVFSSNVELHSYVSFFHSLPFLAWITPYIPVYSLAVLFNIEYMFNATPRTLLSSVVLFGTNLLLGWVTTKYYKQELDDICPMLKNKNKADEKKNNGADDNSKSATEDKNKQKKKSGKDKNIEKAKNE